MAKAQAPAIGIDLGTTYRWGAAQCSGSATLKPGWLAPARGAGWLAPIVLSRCICRRETCGRRRAAPGWMLQLTEYLE
jgi:hypothetical protein